MNNKNFFQDYQFVIDGLENINIKNTKKENKQHKQEVNILKEEISKNVDKIKVMNKDKDDICKQLK